QGANHAVGEDVAALGVYAELCFVDSGEGELIGERSLMRPIVAARPYRHGFRGAEDIARLGRGDPLFPGQEGDLLLPLERYDAVVDFTGKQPEREAYN